MLFYYSMDGNTEVLVEDKHHLMVGSTDKLGSSSNSVLPAMKIEEQTLLEPTVAGIASTSDTAEQNQKEDEHSKSSSDSSESEESEEKTVEATVIEKSGELSEKSASSDSSESSSDKNLAEVDFMKAESPKSSKENSTSSDTSDSSSSNDKCDSMSDVNLPILVQDQSCDVLTFEDFPPLETLLAPSTAKDTELNESVKIQEPKGTATQDKTAEEPKVVKKTNNKEPQVNAEEGDKSSSIDEPPSTRKQVVEVAQRHVKNSFEYVDQLSKGKLKGVVNTFLEEVTESIDTIKEDDNVHNIVDSLSHQIEEFIVTFHSKTATVSDLASLELLQEKLNDLQSIKLQPQQMQPTQQALWGWVTGLATTIKNATVSVTNKTISYGSSWIPGLHTNNTQTHNNNERKAEPPETVQSHDHEPTLSDDETTSTENDPILVDIEIGETPDEIFE
uniref:Uncharacterized protein n=1 Tax=Vannella robusta TaxID=1487602 RepID=A0A7S4M3V8_9EUKA